LRIVVLALLLSCFTLSASENLALENAVKRFEQIVNDESALSDKWSSSYFIMHKRLYGESAYLKDFEYLTGIGNVDKAALLYKAFDAKDQSRTTLLIKMKVENSIWEVQSIATYDLSSFEKNKSKLVE